MYQKQSRFSRRCLWGKASLFLLIFALINTAWADGTETLGPPSIAIAQGTNIVAAGTGLIDPPQPGTINIDVPGTVKQALLYWEGQNATDPGPDQTSITVNGNPVTGDLIGGPTFFFSGAYSSAYRADITNLVGTGPNTLTVEGLSFTKANNGAGVLVIYDAGGTTDVQLRDGLDLAFINFSEPLKSTVPQTFVVEPANTLRTAQLDMFFSSVEGNVSGQGPLRPSTIEITVEQADVVGFEDISVPGDFTVPLLPFASEGFDFTSSSDIFIIADAGACSSGPCADNGTQTLVSTSGAVVTITASSGGDFSIRSLDLGEGLNANGSFPRAKFVTVTGTLVDDSTISETFELDDQCCTTPASTTSADFQTLTTIALAGQVLKSATISAVTETNAAAAFSLDNIAFNAPNTTTTTTLIITELNSNDGQEWDTLTAQVDFPAVANLITVQAFSRDDEGTGKLPASFAWTAAGLSFPTGPFPPGIEIEKLTNGYDADAANGFPVLTPPPGPGFPGDVGGNKVPVVKIGDDITWSYVVTNTGGEVLTDIMVTDSKVVGVICPSTTLDPGASFTCKAMGTGLDLADDLTSVDGCGSDGQGMSVPTYENKGTVVGFGATSGVKVTDEDPSHYCNPPDVLIKKFTNGWDGDDANGMPNADPGKFEDGAPQVAEIPSGDDITWTYIVTNTSSEKLINVKVTDDRTDDRGVMVTCPADTLAPAGQQGDSITCTATGTAEALQSGAPNVAGCGSGTGETRPTYENLGTVTALGETTNLMVKSDDPSHYCNPLPPPPCGLTLEKGCEIPPPALPSVGKCKGKLQQFTMIWDGADDTPIGRVPLNNAGRFVDNGEEVTFLGPFSNNDVVVDVGSGQSKFHVSCSDKDMDGDSATNEDQDQVSPVGRDCGKNQGDGKGSSGINEWLLEGFVDKESAVLDCTLSAEVGDSSCTFQAIPADCDFPNKKPDILTFRVTGGDCKASDNAQKADKTECTGGFINPNQAVQVSVNGDQEFTLEPGGSFDVERGGNPEIELFQDGVAQFNKFHASCSQPLQAGDRYGANGLVALDGAGLGTTVVYSYLVGNVGPGDLTGITVTDDQLGTVPGSPIGSLAEDASDTLTATAFITQTTTNTATAVASPTCQVDSNPVLVTVLPPPLCEVSIAFKDLKNDKIKWTLSNGPERKATLETLTLMFPAAYGALEEVKLDGAIFKAKDSDTYPNGVPSGETIGPDDWTELDVAKRQLDQGEDRTLEVKFTDKPKDFNSDDFTLTLTFEEGCIAGVNTP